MAWLLFILGALPAAGLQVAMSMDGVEESRRALERAMRLSESAGGRTMSGTKRRQVENELALIEQLGDEDPRSAIAGLWKAWYTERGTKNLDQLSKVDAWIGGGVEYWPSAIKLAEALSAQNPDWAEPKNRLATVLYLQGRYDDSVELCEEVLRLKPHHFGAASGICLCHMKRGDVEAATRWSGRQLPPNLDDRRLWVKDRIADYHKLIGEPSE
ncbi:hypothetical protein CTAYLR_009184 [Chrysophaeum taylorii]|uniref:Tetratricopeptide repeat protein n=1 Tax=Chrysophaeum taylorii TaxID=2483200 RepID=A0AAD7UHK0_9STRA|nr:hypothetical protein CTAYLR_009184 [Chrysophaeum taylorii]